MNYHDYLDYHDASGGDEPISQPRVPGSPDHRQHLPGATGIEAQQQLSQGPRCGVQDTQIGV